MADCFWTDLLNATQECAGGSPAPPGYEGVILISMFSNSPFVRAYRFNSQTGFGAIYPDRDTPMLSGLQRAEFSPDGNYIVFAYDTDAGIGYAHSLRVCPWDNATGFGPDVDNGSTDSSSFCPSAMFSPDNDAVAFCCSRLNNSLVVSAIEWDAETGEFGTQYTGPGTKPPNVAKDVSFHPDGTAVAFAHWNSPTISVYRWSHAGGFGARYTGPTSLPSMSSNQGRKVRFHPSGGVLMWVITDAPYILAYEFNPSAGFGSRYMDPATPPTGIADGFGISNDGRAVAVGSRTSPYIRAYPFTRFLGFGPQFADPGVTPTGYVNHVEWSPDNTCVAVAHANSPYCSVYRWSHATGFGEKLANPDTLPGGPNRGALHVTFHPQTQ